MDSAPTYVAAIFPSFSFMASEFCAVTERPYSLSYDEYNSSTFSSGSSTVGVFYPHISGPRKIVFDPHTLTSRISHLLALSFLTFFPQVR